MQTLFHFLQSNINQNTFKGLNIIIQTCFKIAIMKLRISIIFVLLSTLTTIGQNTIVWTSDTVKIYEDFNVPEETTLIINPGVVVEFQGHYSLNVMGKVEAIGTRQDSILFTMSDTTGFMNEWIIDGGWHGISFGSRSANDTSFFKYCKFEYGKSWTFKYDTSSSNSGGAIYAKKYSNIKITNSLFHYNFAGNKGAGIYVNELKSLLLRNNDFINNNSKDWGGGVFLKSTKSIIKNNLFYKNIAFRIDTIWIHDTIIYAIGLSGAGSAVSSEGCPEGYPNIVDNKMFNNKSIGGTIWESSKYSKIINNTICNNEDYGFFDAYGYYSHKVIINNIIVNNFRKWGGDYGGIWSISQHHKFVNNIVYGNRSPFGYVQFSSPDLPIDYCCIQDGYNGTGNISTNPQFTNPTPGAGIDYDGLSADWTLLETSPCINTGTPDTTGLNLPEFDLAGNPRIFGGRIDIGAYENQSVYVKINESPVYSKIKLYPNPGSDKIYIDIPPEMEGAWIDIVDGQGKVLMHKQIQMSPAVLSPYKLQSGIYFYRIYSENKVVKSGKWVKR